MKQFFLNLFSAEKEVDSKPFRRILYALFFQDYYTNLRNSVTEIKVFKKKDKYIVRITSHHVGLLVGKGGRTLKELTEFLNNGEFTLPVEVELKESQMWLNLYNY